jgi:nicotinamide mononucleotide transporter
VNVYEIIAVIFGVVAVWLTIRENIWCWPIGLVNVVLYIVVFREAKLYSDMLLQVIYVFLSIWGWYEWLHGGAGKTELPVSGTSRRKWTIFLIAGVIGAALLGLFFKRNTDASLPFWDASLTSFSLIAQWMQTFKLIENWIVWIIVDAIYVGLYLYKRLDLTAGLYFLFLVLAIKGYIDWQRSLHAAQAKRL